MSHFFRYKNQFSLDFDLRLKFSEFSVKFQIRRQNQNHFGKPKISFWREIINFTDIFRIVGKFSYTSENVHKFRQKSAKFQIWRQNKKSYWKTKALILGSRIRFRFSFWHQI